MKCIPWYLPRGKYSEVCDPWTAQNFTASLNDLDDLDLDTCGCLPNCNETVYAVTTSAAEFRYSCLPTSRI